MLPVLLLWFGSMSACSERTWLLSLDWHESTPRRSISPTKRQVIALLLKWALGQQGSVPVIHREVRSSGYVPMKLASLKPRTSASRQAIRRAGGPVLTKATVANGRLWVAI